MSNAVFQEELELLLSCFASAGSRGDVDTFFFDQERHKLIRSGWEIIEQRLLLHTIFRRPSCDSPDLVIKNNRDLNLGLCLRTFPSLGRS